MYSSCRFYPLIIAITFFIPIYGCNDSLQTAPADQTEPIGIIQYQASHANDIEHPFKASLFAANDLIAPNEIIPPGEPGSEERCNQEGLFTAKFSGTGETTHIGRVTFLAVNCTEPPIPGPADFDQGIGTMTAVNGRDVINLSYSGLQTAPNQNLIANLTFDVEIIGGEGRFENATGKATTTGTVNFDTGDVYLDSEGQISYNPSIIADN